MRNEPLLWRRAALPASLVLNLFFVALIGGHLWRVDRILHGAREPLARVLAQAEASLPPHDAAAFGAVLRRDRPQYAASFEDFVAARRRVGAAIAAPAFDPATVRQALAAWQASWNRFLGDFSTPLVDALAQVSPDGRRRLIAERQRGEEPAAQ